MEEKITEDQIACAKYLIENFIDAEIDLEKGSFFFDHGLIANTIYEKYKVKINNNEIYIPIKDFYVSKENHELYIAVAHGFGYVLMNIYLYGEFKGYLICIMTGFKEGRNRQESFVENGKWKYRFYDETPYFYIRIYQKENDLEKKIVSIINNKNNNRINYELLGVTEDYTIVDVDFNLFESLFYYEKYKYKY